MWTAAIVLVLTIKAQVHVEPEPLTRVIAARNEAIMAGGVRQQAAAEERLSEALRALFDAVSHDAALQADGRVRQLRGELAAIERALVSAGQQYNEAVVALNGAHDRMPTSVLAGVFQFAPAASFEPQDA